jgi:flavodoxin
VRTAIIYYSKHKGNTKKLLDAIAAEYPVDLYDSKSVKTVDLGGYELIGFASGVYCEHIDRSVIKLGRKFLPENKKVFFIYTCGSLNDGYAKPVLKLAEKKNAEFLGLYGCTGHYKISLFGKCEEKKTGHPDVSEIAGAVEFFGSIQK